MSEASEVQAAIPMLCLTTILFLCSSLSWAFFKGKFYTKGWSPTIFTAETPFIFTEHMNLRKKEDYMDRLRYKYKSKIKFEPTKIGPLIRDRMLKFFNGKAPRACHVPTKKGIDYIMYLCHAATPSIADPIAIGSAIEGFDNSSILCETGPNQYFLVIPIAEVIIGFTEWYEFVYEKKSKKREFDIYDLDYMKKYEIFAETIVEDKMRIAYLREKKRQEELEAELRKLPSNDELQFQIIHPPQVCQITAHVESRKENQPDENDNDDSETGIVEPAEKQIKQPARGRLENLKVWVKEFASKAMEEIETLNISGRAQNTYEWGYLWILDNPRITVITLAVIALLLTLLIYL